MILMDVDFPGAIGDLSHDGLVQPHDAVILFITRGASPVFVIINS